jgi:hypothetical protein
VNTVLTGEATFQYLHEKTADGVQDALKRATKHIDYCLNLISGRLGLDHDQVFVGRFRVPVMARYLDQRASYTHGPTGERLHVAWLGFLAVSIEIGIGIEIAPLIAVPSVLLFPIAIPSR